MKTIFVAAALAAAAPLAPVSALAAPAPAEQHAALFSVAVEGEGPDVILLPGLMSPRSVWDEAAAGLGPNYRLHRVQLGGFAGEPAGAFPPGRLLPSVVEQLHDYIAANRLQRPRIVGHSMGGLLALMLADAHPEDVGSLLIVDALPFAGMLFGPQLTVDAVEPQAAALKGQIAAMGDEAFRAQEQASAARLALTDGARAHIVDWAMASDRALAAEALYEDLTTDLRPRLAAIHAPITVAYAVNAALPRAQAEALFRAGYAAAPDARLVPVEDSAHFIMLDQPARFGELLARFLAED